MKIHDAVRLWLTAGLTVFIVSTMPLVMAQSANTLTLSEAVARTLDTYPSLQRFMIIQRQQALDVDIAALKPGYTVDVELENVLGSRQFQAVDSAELTVALSSVIELGDKQQARTSLTQARLDKTATEKRVMTLDVLGKLVADYIAVLSIQEELALKREARQISADMLRSVQNRFDNGAASEAELMLASARLSQAEIDLAQVSAELQRSQTSLSLYWGKADPDFDRLEGDFLQFDPLRSLDQLLRQLDESPALEIYADRARLQAAELSLQASQSRQDVSWQFGLRHLAGSNDTALVAGVSIPLFVAQRNQTRVERERLDQPLLVMAKEQAQLDLQSRLMRAHSLYQQSVSAATRMQNDVIPKLERALVVTRDGYEQGLLRYQELIIAEQELLDARDALIHQATQAHQSLALIEQLTGMTLRMTSQITSASSAQ